MTNAISVSNLVKSFGRTRALDGLNLAVRTGEVHGFLGPNGAGKTTTIRILLGLLRADAGETQLLGGDPWHQATELHRRLAYVPGDVTLWPNLSGGEIIDLLGRLRGGLDPRRRADLLERFELDPRKKARTYSKGNRQKVALVAALASDVELLILDEPTSGLDPTVVGRHAALSAVLIVTCGADLLIAILVAGGLIGVGFPPSGSFALGFSVAAIGWTFALLAGVTAQLTESAGAANGIAGSLLGFFYLLRAVGDMGERSGLA